MGQTSYADLLKFQDAYGIPPEQSAKAFGVDLPPPPPADVPIAPVAPMDLGGTLPPAHPGMLSDPGNLAVKEKKPVPLSPYAQAIVDTGDPTQLSLDSPYRKEIQQSPYAEKFYGTGPKMDTRKPVEFVPVAPKTFDSEAIYRENNPQSSGDKPAEGKVRQPTSVSFDRNIPEMSKEEAELKAAQSFQRQATGDGAQRNATGGGAGGPGLSEQDAYKRVLYKTGEDPLEHAALSAKQAEAADAQGNIMAQREAGQRAVAEQWHKIGYMDRLASEDAQDRLQAEQARQAAAEDELKRATARAMAAPKDDGMMKIGQMIAYAMAGIGNVLNIKAGGQPTDIVQRMMANDDAAAERRYQRQVATVKGLKLDAQEKTARLRQLEADKIAGYAQRRKNAVDAFQGVLANNEANLTAAQKEFYDKNVDMLRQQGSNEYNSGLRRLTHGEQAQHAAQQAAAAAPSQDFVDSKSLKSEELVPAGTFSDGSPRYMRVMGDTTEAKEIRNKIVGGTAIHDAADRLIKIASAGGYTADPTGATQKQWKRDVSAIQSYYKEEGEHSDSDAVRVLDRMALGDASRTGIGTRQDLEALATIKSEAQRKIDSLARTKNGGFYERGYNPKTRDVGYRLRDLGQATDQLGSPKLNKTKGE